MSPRFAATGQRRSAATLIGMIALILAAICAIISANGGSFLAECASTLFNTKWIRATSSFAESSSGRTASESIWSILRSSSVPIFVKSRT
jgi:hypothetical protein